LAVDYQANGNWFVHQYRTISRAAAVHAAEQGRPSRRNTYGLQLWTPNTAATTAVPRQQRNNDTDSAVATPTTQTTRQFLPEIPIQPKPFLSHN
jgi:hypothetical protein